MDSFLTADTRRLIAERSPMPTSPCTITLSIVMPSGVSFSATGPEEIVLKLYAEWRRLAGYDPTLTYVPETAVTR